MKIALPYLEGNIYHSLMRTGRFIIYQIEDGKIVNQEFFITHGQRSKELAELLSEMGVEVMLCTHAGRLEAAALDNECIELQEGYEGSTKEAVLKYCRNLYMTN